MDSCKTCEHWELDRQFKKYPGYFPERSNVGACTNSSDEPGARIKLLWDHQLPDWIHKGTLTLILETHANFCCSNYKRSSES